MSGLCVAHCFVTAMLLGLLASAGGIFESPIFHEVGLGLAILLGAVALGHGAVVHGFMMPAAVGALGLGVMTGALTMDHGLQESVYTLIGVGILALATNLLSAVILFRHRKGDSNMRSVWLCTRNDAIANLAVIAGASGVWASGTGWPDLAVGAVIAALALSSSVAVLHLARGELREEARA